MDYPRPQFRRSNWINLNGKWKFCETNEINVPFAPETELSGIGEEAFKENLKYERTFELPSFAGRFLLNFEGVDYIAKVYINDVFVGEHRGGYTRFSFDITKFVRSGTNTITVLTHDSNSLAQPRGKQRWKPESWECWYVQTSGIWKTVWLENVPEDYIKPIKVSTDYKNKLVTFEQANEINKTIIYDGEVLAQTTENTVDLSKNFHAWTPDTPSLYTVIYKNKAGDAVESYFAFREIKVEGRNILLNGKPIYQKLILNQGYWSKSGMTPPSAAALKDDINKIKQMGFNGVRMHTKVEDERFYYLADKMGLLVWAEMPACYEFSENFKQNYLREWKTVINQLYCHPSIIVWVPFNESWGLPDVSTNKKQQEFSKQIYRLTKKTDNTRLVVGNDGWEHTVSDIITLHDYESDGKALKDKYANIDSVSKHNTLLHKQLNKRIYSEGFTYNGQPIIMSEFGGVAFEGDGWGYGDAVNNKDEFIERVRSVTMAVAETSYMCGYCYTQLTDVYQEKNGLLDFNHEYKIDPNIIRAINDSI